LRMVWYNAPLYRGDDMTSLHTRANKHYGTEFHKFFATKEASTKRYIKNELKGYIKTWEVTEPLHLLDIMDPDTRGALARIIPHPEFLDTGFPMKDNKVYRYSEEYTKKIDGKLLAELCQIQTADGSPIDGYYMDEQTDKQTIEGRNMIPFHSEVGLCNSAFKKLLLVGEPKRYKEAPDPKRKRNTRKRNLANKQSSPAKKPKGTVLFQNMRNNSNNNSNNHNNNSNNNNNNSNNNNNNNNNSNKKHNTTNTRKKRSKFVPAKLLNLM